MYQYLLVYSYILSGLYFSLKNYKLHQYYMILLLFFLFKSLFNYRKCTFSYIEVKLRKVKKTQGRLYGFLDRILDIRKTNHIQFIYLICSIIIYHFYGVMEARIDCYDFLFKWLFNG